MFLLFVLPIHTTLAQIACEHLPTPYGEAADSTKSSKVLRSSADKPSCSCRYTLDGDCDVPALLLAEGEGLSRTWIKAEPVPLLAVTPIENAPLAGSQRAPPFV